MNLQKDFARIASSSITQDRAKLTGEVFTPLELVNTLLDQFPMTVWSSGKTFFEPAAGDGNFVIEVLKRKIKVGHCTPTEAILDVFAIDYMQDNVNVMKERVLALIGDTPQHREIVNDHIVYANTLDANDRSEGRRFPAWLLNEKNFACLDI